MNGIKIAHIVAMDEAGVIGRGDYELPWSIKEDMKYFSQTTTGHAVIMGRKTHFSIGRPLPNRRNLVVTSRPQMIKTVEGICSLPVAIAKAIKHAETTGKERIFIIGGGEIYKATADLVDEVFVTLVKGEHEGDRFYQMPAGMVQVDCSGPQTNGTETFFFKRYARG